MTDDLLVPAHVGIVLDGNRRWAKEKGLSTLEGHRQGSEVFKSLALQMFDRGISFVSAYVFSTENWSRTEEEVGYLMKLVTKAVESYLGDFNDANIRLVVLGSRDKLPVAVISAIDKAEQNTKKNTAGTLALCFNYGGQQEVVEAVKNIVSRKVPAEEITETTIAGALYQPDIPPVDLLIRTSGEQRTSGFMLYRAAYAELLFIKKYWPDMTIADIDVALDDYRCRQRRFGS
ncbi:decaprenyl diphosphate synthase [soil metagenome]